MANHALASSSSLDPSANKQLAEESSASLWKESEKKKNKECTASFSAFMKHLRQRESLSPAKEDCQDHNTLVLYLLNITQHFNGDWKVAQFFLREIMTRVSAFPYPSLRELVGPPQANGDYFTPLFGNTIFIMALHSTSTADSSASRPSGARSHQPSSQYSPEHHVSGSASRDDEHSVFCKHHNSWYKPSEDHSSESCKAFKMAKGKPVSNRRP
jgi:hypothetical protein